VEEDGESRFRPQEVDDMLGCSTFEEALLLQESRGIRLNLNVYFFYCCFE